MDLAKEAAKATSASDYIGAINLYTRALIQMPRAAPYYIERSKAYTRLATSKGASKHNSALRDAEIGLTLATERGNRELILSAQMRRAISLYNLGRLGDAEYLFASIEAKTRSNSDKQKTAQANKVVPSPDPLGSAVSIHLNKVRRELGDLPEGDEKARVAVSVEVKGVHIPAADELKAELDLAQKSGNISSTDDPSSAAPSTSNDNANNTTQTGNPSSSVAAASLSPVIQEFRHEWYQSNDSVVVIIYVKGAIEDSLELKTSEDSISGSFLASGGDGVNNFSFSPLYGPITGEPTVSVKSNKIEMTLRKKLPVKKWHSLKAPANAPEITDRPVASVQAPATGPVYPTSSRHGAKDWDKTINEIDSSREEDAGGDAVDDFFKKLYASADPDAQRAMQKSYIESNGTSLSTNWDEVGKKTIEPYPPA